MYMHYGLFSVFFYFIKMNGVRLPFLYYVFRFRSVVLCAFTHLRSFRVILSRSSSENSHLLF